VHPEGRVFVEFPSFLQPGGATKRIWLSLVYKSDDAMFSASFLRECPEAGAKAVPCAGVPRCSYVPGSEHLMFMGRSKGRMLEVARALYFWDTDPRLCAIVNLRVLASRPEYGPLTRVLREFPIRVRVLAADPQ